MDEIEYERDFLLDPSCILYLPLWKKDGDVICSEDRFGQAFTRYGALWTPKGYQFDGINDELNSPNSTLFDASEITILSWFNITNFPASEASGVANYVGWSGQHRGYQTSVSSAGYYTFLIGDGVNTPISINTPVSKGVWNCGAGVYKGNTSWIFLNGEYKNTATVSPFDGIASGITHGFEIGVQFSDADRFFEGIIGEVVVYGRARSRLFVRNYFDMTKWRYV